MDTNNIVDQTSNLYVMLVESRLLVHKDKEKPQILPSWSPWVVVSGGIVIGVARSTSWGDKMWWPEKDSGAGTAGEG